jgi:ubiquinone/menaquinone biosynthesis C-methylase UbiE
MVFSVLSHFKKGNKCCGRILDAGKLLSGWSEFQTAEEMEIARKYEYDPEFVPFLRKWLGLGSKFSAVVVDIGCGSGYFTRIVAGCMKGNGRVIGVDSDRKLVKEAERICKERGFSNVQFLTGSVWNIPLKSDCADLVVSHVVLSNIPRQFDVILEMKRVVKVGGRVAVIDSARGGGQYFPDERLNELSNKFLTALGKAIDIGWRQRLGTPDYMENFHLRIPHFFLKAGLSNITMNGYLSTFLLCDLRRRTSEMRTFLQAKLDSCNQHAEKNLECALMGGMKKEEYHELLRKYTKYLEDLIKHPRKIKKTPEVNVVSRVIVCGRKVAK